MVQFKMYSTIKWLVVFLALCSSAHGLTDGACKQSAIASPSIYFSTGSYDPATMTPLDCKYFCFDLGYPYTAIEEGQYCYCFDDDSGLTDAAGSCTMTCSDGTPCGGAEMGYFTVFNSQPTGGHIELLIATFDYAVAETVTLTVNASLGWLVDWGDGSEHTANGTTHAYTLPGEYFIQAYLELFNDVVDTAPVNIFEKPNGTLICPENVNFFENATCKFFSVSHGQDYILTREYTEPGFPTLTYDIPGELSTAYGSVLGDATIGNVTTIAAGTIIILHQRTARAGKIARVEVNAATTGHLAIYGVRPSCASGEYCWQNDKCGSGCTQSSAPVTCSSSDTYCMSREQCSAASVCPTTTTASITDVSVRLITTIYVDAANTNFLYLDDLYVHEVYQGERLAVGCAEAADCQSSPPNLNTRSIGLLEAKDELGTVSAGVAVTSAISDSKNLVRILVRDDILAPLSYEVNCSVASSVPTANVPQPFSVTSEQYVFLGFFNLTYTMYSEHIGSGDTWTATTGMRCQQEILAPTVQLEQWVPLLIETPLQIAFTQGAPIFVSLDMLSTLGLVYDYKDNASDYTWISPMVYTETGDFTIVGNVSNALNWEPFTSLIRVVPVVTDTWVLTANCLCLTWTDGFELVITFPSAINPPFNANVTATYNDGVELVPAQVLDFGTRDGGGAAQELTQIFDVIISEPGNHTIVFTLVNEVSNTTFEAVVEVNAHITDVNMTLNWLDEGTVMPGLGDGNTFMVNETIYFTPSTGTGTSDKWKITLYPSEEVLIETTGPVTLLSHNFTKETDYNITISAYNEVQGWVESEFIPLSIITEITGFELTDDGEILKPFELKTVTASFIILPPVSCVLITFDADKLDGFQTYGYRPLCEERYYDATYMGGLTNPHDFIHNYTVEGMYTVSAVAFDSRISKKLQLSVVIADIFCTMPVVDILNKATLVPDAPEIWKSLQFFRAAEATLNCTKPPTVKRWWTISEIDRRTAEPIQDIFVEGVLASWNYSQITVTPRFLDYGIYELRYFLKLIINKDIYLQRDVATLVRIIETPLSAIIAKGSVSSITRGFSQKLHLEPNSLSIDADDEPDTVQNFNVTWWCRAMNGSVPEELASTTNGEGITDYEMTDLINIPAPLVAIKSDLKGGGCFGDGPGTLALYQKNFEFNMQTFVKFGADFQIIARISKGHRIASTSIIVSILENNPPTMLLGCVDADICYPYQGLLLINPSSRLALTGACSLDCGSNLAYNWSISDIDGNPIQESSPETECATETESTDSETAAVLSPPTCEGVFITPKTTKDLSVSTMFFKINPDVLYFKFRVAGTNSESGKPLTGFAENLIKVNQSPHEGTCATDKAAGLALVDTFLTACSDWVDPEDMGITTYVFYSLRNVTTSDKPLKTSLVASAKYEVELILSVGYHEIRCQVFDILDCFTDVHVGFIDVTMPTEEQFQNMNLSDVIDNAKDAGDQVKLAMVLQAWASVRENADWLNLDGALDTGNMTQEELLENIKQIADMNYNTLVVAQETMDFATLPQINVGAEVLMSAVDGILTSEYGALTVDMKTREAALDLVEKMTDTLDVVSIKSPQELVPFIDKSMTAITAMMQGINNILEGNDTMIPPTDEADAEDWDYDTEVKYDPDSQVPLDRETQLKQNVLESTKRKAKEQVDRMMDIVDNLITKVLNKCVVGETVATQTQAGASILIAKITEEILKLGMVIDPQDGKNASIIFPPGFCPSHYSYPDTDCKKELGISAVVWPGVTHVYPDSREMLTSKTRIVDVAVNINGKMMNITNESIPIEIKIPKDPEPLDDPLLVNASDCINSVVPFVYHEFKVENNHSAFTIEITPVEDFPQEMVLLLDHERLPIPSDFNIIYLIRDLPINDNGSYILFVNGKENGNRMGRFFAAVSSLKEDVADNEALQGRNFTTNDFMNITSRYLFRAFTSGCYFYDKEIEEWLGDGVYVDEVLEKSIKCKTKHLTPFGTGFFNTPNTVDFQYVFVNAGFVNNLTLYVVLIILLVCYIVMMIWARFMDKKDIEYRGVEALEDNDVEDKYLYEITLSTGPDKEAGTDSNIQFILSGEYNETEVRILPPSEGKRYHRYCVDAFVIAVPQPLGEIHYLRIWHDHSGQSPFNGWQLQSAVVRDLQTREKYVFRSDVWLALDRSDTVDVLLKPSDYQKYDSFSREFYLKGNRSANEDNMWMSIFMRPVGSRFSRKERVSVAAFFLYLSLMLNALWYDAQPNSPENAFLKLGIINVSYEQVMIGFLSGCAVYPVTFLIIIIFKRARPYRLKKCRALDTISKHRREELEKNNIPVEDDPINNYDQASSSSDNPSKDQNTVKCIPWWTRWLAWLILLATIGACIFFVWTYGVMWGEIKTTKWLSSFIFSFFISVLIVQWLNVLIITSINSICCGKEDFTIEDIDCDEELPHLNYDEAWKNVKPMDPSVKRKALDIGGVDGKDPYIADLAVKLKKRREMLLVIRDIGIYCLFLIILAVIISEKTDINAFYLQTHMTNAFIKVGHRDLDFSSKIITADHLWLWIQNVVMKEIRAQRRYNNEPPYGLRGYLGDLNNRLLGYGIIRQVRSDPRKCHVIKPLDELILRCSGSRGLAMEDNRNFCNSWETLDDGKVSNCFAKEFLYNSADKLETFSQIAKLGEYSGGGYVIDLKGEQKVINQRFKELQELHWIDKYTRAVMLEFATFNPNVRLFATGSVIAEFNEGGGITPKWRFTPLKLLKDDGYYGTIVFLSEIVFVLATALFTMNELWKLKKEKCKYFDSYWNMAEVCLITVSYACIGLYVYRYVLTKEVTEKFNETNGNEYIRLDRVALVDQFYLYGIAFVVFFSILKLIKLLQFNKRMDVLALTIRLCWDELSIFFIAFGIVFFAFCCLFYFVFLADIENFAKFVSAVETSFKMMLGKFDFEEMNRANPISPILFFVFSVLNSMIMINIMLTIILRAFNDVKVELEKKENKYDIIDFVTTSVRRTFKMEEKPDNSLQPNLDSKNNRRMSDLRIDQKAEQLPDKVSQLMTYISDTYFDGKINLNDPAAVKKIMQGTNMSAAKRRPFTSRLNMSIGPRQVISSD